MNVCIIHMNGFLSRPHFNQVQRCQLKKTESGRSPVNLLSKPHIKLHLFKEYLCPFQHKSQGIKYPKMQKISQKMAGKCIINALGFSFTFQWRHYWRPGITAHHSHSHQHAYFFFFLMDFQGKRERIAAVNIFSFKETRSQISN